MEGLVRTLMLTGRWLLLAALATPAMQAAVTAEGPADEAQSWYVIPFDVDPLIQIDGELDDWAAVPNAIRLSTAEHVTLGRELWRGPDDLQATVRLAWRGDAILIGAEVIDDAVAQPYSDQSVFRGDHVNLFLDFAPNTEPARNALGEGQYHIGLSPGNIGRVSPGEAGAAEVVSFAPEGLDVRGACDIASRRTSRGYIVEARIPFNILGGRQIAQGDDANFTVAVSDADGVEVIQESWMTPGTKPWHYGRHMLGPAVFGDGNGKGEPRPRGMSLADTFTIEPGSKHEISFKAEPVSPEKRPYLFFRARIDCDSVRGFVSNAMTVDLNGTRVQGDALSNRPPDGTMMRGDHDLYVTPDGRIMLWYASGFDAVEAHPQYRLIDGVKACEFEFRLDGLRAGKNRLVFHNDAEAMPDIGRTAVAGGVELRYRTPPAPKSYAPAPTGPLPIHEARTCFPPAFTEPESERAMISFQVGDETFKVASRFSAPDGRWHTGGNRFYKHMREVTPRGEWIEVRDTFKNLTGENVPIMQEHRCPLGDPFKAAWLAGIALPSGEGERSLPENPSAFAVTAKSGVGMIALNDAFRVHITTGATDGEVYIADRGFVLKPGAAYIAEWAILPTAEPDHWAFVNAARRMMGVNFRLEPMFTFAFHQEPIYDWTDQRLRDFVRFKSANFVVQSNEASRYHGAYAYARAFAAVTRKPYIDFQKRIRGLFPDGDVKTGVYYHCFVDNFHGADDEAFADDRILDAAGNHVNYGGQHTRDQLYVPTLSNEFGRVTGRNVDIILDEIGADGVFWDEHQISRVNYTYNPAAWDGCSADIDPRTMHIRQLRSSIALLSLPWRKAIAERIMAHGPLITNGAPHTRTMLELRYPAFVETGSISYCGKMLLHSPIGLGDHLTERTFLDAYQGMCRMLDHGCLYAWYGHQIIPTYPTLTEHMFPFTPVELHAGYVIGVERILTNRSGLFGWGDDARFEAYVYDRNGRRTQEIEVPRVIRDGKAYAEVRLPEGYSAAIVRRDLEREPGR